MSPNHKRRVPQKSKHALPSSRSGAEAIGYGDGFRPQRSVPKPSAQEDAPVSKADEAGPTSA